MSAAISGANHERNRQAWMVWHIAVFSRIKKIPKLETLLVETSEKKLAKQPEAWQVSYAKMNVWAMQTNKRKH